MQQLPHVLHFQPHAALLTLWLNAWRSEVLLAFICVLKSLAMFLLPLFKAQVCSFYSPFIMCLLLDGLFVSDSILCAGFMQAGRAIP